MAEIELEQMMRLSEVRRATGVSKPTIYRWMQQGRFPGSVPVGPNSVRWRASEVRRWQESRFDQAGTSAK